MEISIPRPVVDCGAVDVRTGEVFSVVVVVVCVVVIVVVVVSDAESSMIGIILC